MTPGFMPLRMALPYWPEHVFGEPAALDTIGLIDWDIDDDDASLSVSGAVGWYEEVAIDLPGVDGLALVLAPLDGTTAIAFELDIMPDVELRLTDLGFALRYDTDLLRRVEQVEGSWKPKLDGDGHPTPAEMSFSGVGVTVDLDGNVAVDGQPQVDLGAVAIGDTGVVVEMEGLTPYLSRKQTPPAGAPDGFRGVTIDSLKVHLPDAFDLPLPDTLEGEDLLLGTGGFSGRITGHWGGEGEDDPVEGSLFGVAFALHALTLEFRQNSPTEIAIEGALTLPFFDEPVGVEVGIDVDGDISASLSAVEDSDSGHLATLERDGVLELGVESLGFAVVDGLPTVSISGELTPLVMPDQLDWPTFKVDELAIDADGNVHLEGGWLDLPEQHVLDFHGFQVEIAELGFGRTDDGGKWVGFSGGVKLVEGLQAGASVEGLRIAWYDDGDVAVSFEGIGVEFEIPEVLAFKGAVSYREDAGAHVFTGAISVVLDALDMTIDGQLVVGRDASGEMFLAIYVGVDLPAGIPLFATNLSLYGFAGLVAIGMEPNRGQGDPDEGWFLNDDGSPGWYLRDEPGVVDLANKWAPVPGSFAFGAGVTIGTAPDNGYAFNGSLLLVIAFPGPIILLEGRGDLLTDRADGDGDPLFRALAILDNRAGTFTVGLDGGYRFADGGELIDIDGQIEAFFDFADASAWYINLGEDEPADRRIQARMYSLFQASGYVMLDPRRLAMGARFEIDEHWSFGPASVALAAYAGADARISFRPAHFHGRIGFGGSIDISIFRFGFLIALDAELAADVFTPMHIRGDLRIVLELPWPFSDWERDISFEWGPQPDPPPLPAPVKEVAVEHFKSTATWPLRRGALLVPELVTGDGFLKDDYDAVTEPADADIPIVPLDGRPRITFGRSVHDDALVCVNPQDVQPNAKPAGWEWIGDPEADEGEVRVRYGLADLTLERRAGDEWEPVAKASADGDDDVERLYGSWAPMPELATGTAAEGTEEPLANTKLWLWSKTPFDHTRHGGRSWDDWFLDDHPGYPCVPVPPERVLHCDFADVPAGEVLGSSWECPEHPGLVLSWDAPDDLTVTVLATFAAHQIKALCWPAEALDEQEGPQPNTVRIRLPEPAGKVRLWYLSEHDLVDVRGYDVDGQLVFTQSDHGQAETIDVTGTDLDTVVLTWARGTFCLRAIEVTIPPEPGHVELREKMAEHLANEVARWSDEDYVLRPHTTYRLRIETTVETREWPDSGFNRVRELTEFAYFRTEGPPGLTELSVPDGQDSSSSGNGDRSGGFDSGLGDLDRYIAQTVPPTVPAKGEQPTLPRPVYRAYDVGVIFDVGYVDLMYRIAARRLRLYLFDANDRPARDAAGRLIITSNRWGTLEERALEYSQSRWLELVDTSECTVLGDVQVPGDATVSTAAADGQVLDADTVYEARLAPLLFSEDFSGGLHRWEVIDEDASGASAWATVPAADLDDAPDDDLGHGVVVQTGTIGGGAEDPGDPEKPGTVLVAGDASWTDYRFSAQARSSAGRAIGLVFRHGDAGCYRFSMDREGGYRRLVKVAGGVHTVLAEDAGAYDLDRDYLLTVEAIGSSLRVLVDGDLLFEADDGELTSGRAGPYCWSDDGARFSDVAVDDLSGGTPVVARFSFATSRFANFAHHLHSFDDRAWRSSIPLDVPAADVDAVRARGNDPDGDVGDDETRGYATLADLVTGGLAVQPPATVEATWVVHDGDTVALWLLSPEPIDWRRASLAIARAADPLPAVRLPGPMKVIDVETGDDPDDAIVSLLLRETLDPTGWALEHPRVPGALAAPEAEPAAVIDASEEGDSVTLEDDLLWSEDFSLPGLDGWRFVDEPPYTIRASDWVVVDGELRELTNLYGFVDAPYGKPGTYGVAGDPVWTDYALAVRLRSDEPAAIGVIVRYRDDDHYYRFSMNAGRRYRRLTRQFAGTTELLWEDDGPVEVGAWHDLEIRCTGNRIIGSLDGETLFDVTDEHPEAIASGRVGVYCRANTGARFDLLRVTDLRDETFRPKLAVTDAGADVLCRTRLPHSDDKPLEVVLRRTARDRYYRLSVIGSTGAAALTRRTGEVYRPLWKGDLSWAGAGAEIVVGADENALRGFVDGVPVFTVQDDTLPTGRVGVGGGDRALEVFAAGEGFSDWMLTDDFTGSTPVGWTIVDEGARDAPSNWHLSGGWLRQTSNIYGLAGGTEHRPGTHALAGEHGWTDYRLSVRLRSDDDDAIGVMVRYRDADNYYRFSMDSERRYRQLIRKLDGAVTVLWEDDVPYDVGREYLVSLACIGSTIAGHVDGEPLFVVTDDALPAGRIGLYCWANDDARFTEVRVAAPAWAAFYRFEDEQLLPAGTRVLVHGGAQSDAFEPEPGTVHRFADAPPAGLGPAGGTVRVTSPPGVPTHERTFPGSSAFEPAAASVLRNADGTGLFVLFGDDSPGACRLSFEYRRDNTAVDPDSLVLSQAGDTGPEQVSLIVPGRG